MNVPLGRLSGVLAALLVFSSCAQAQQPPGVVKQITVGCDETVSGINEPPDTDWLVMGIVGLPGVGGEIGIEPDPAGGYFAKAGLLVRGSHEVVVRIPTTIRPNVALGWGNSPGVAWEATIEACGSDSEWHAYSGGFWVDGPRCAALVIESGDRRMEVEIGLGSPC